jgi:hypothetical protein
MLKLQYHDSAAVKHKQPISLATGYNELQLRKENEPLPFQDFIFVFGMIVRLEAIQLPVGLSGDLG